MHSETHFMDTRLIRTLVIMDSFLGPAPFFLKINPLNKENNMGSFSGPNGVVDCINF